MKQVLLSKKTFRTLFVSLFMLICTQLTFSQVVNITPIRTDVAGFSNWTDSALGTSTTYLQLLTASSSTISPSMNFNDYTSETLNFKARTFGGTTNIEIILTVWISTDNGTNWTNLGTRTPLTSSLTSQTAFDLSSYNGSEVKIMSTSDT